MNARNTQVQDTINIDGGKMLWPGNYDKQVMLVQSKKKQPDKFAISLQYLKKEVSNVLDFLHAGKHRNSIPRSTVF